jgi:hypothetical protein
MQLNITNDAESIKNVRHIEKHRSNDLVQISHHGDRDSPSRWYFGHHCVRNVDDEEMCVSVKVPSAAG